MQNTNAYEKALLATCQNYLIFVVTEQTLLQVATNAWEPKLQRISAWLCLKPWDTREKSRAESGPHSSGWLKDLIPTSPVSSFQLDTGIVELFFFLDKSGREQLVPDIMCYGDYILLLNSPFTYVCLWILPWLLFYWIHFHSRQNLSCHHVYFPFHVPVTWNYVFQIGSERKKSRNKN